MKNLSRQLFLHFAFVALLALLPAAAQTVISTVDVGVDPESAGLNSVTNKAYIVNECGSDPNCAAPAGTVSVIDGSTFSVQTVNTGDYFPYGAAVNSVTNKIYTGTCGSTDDTCYSPGTVTVIDGATLSTHDVAVDIYTAQIAVNPVTNKIYVANTCGTDPNCGSTGTVTVINGATLATQRVSVGAYPAGVVVNSATNKIYVVNSCGNDLTCNSNGTVTVIDGTTLASQSVNVGFQPFLAAVNTTTNKIYVANNCGSTVDCTDGTMTVIDGSTLATQTVQVGIFPYPIAVNPVTNKIYVGNRCGSDPNCAEAPSVSVIDGGTLSPTMVSVCIAGTFTADDMEVNQVTNQLYVACNGRDVDGTSVTVLDGATNNTTSVDVGTNPVAAVVDPLTNRIYVPNSFDNTTSVIAGVNAAPLQFVSVPPCRVVDTRPPNGSGPIPGGTSESFVIPGAGNPPCNIPGSAAAYSLNVTVVPTRPLGYLTIWPTGEDQPVVSTLNSQDGRVKANAAIVPAGYQGAVSVFVTDTSYVILDIDGYFVPGSDSTYQFYPVTPCRVVDTRTGSTQPQGLGPPSLDNMEIRELPILSSPCLQSLPNQPAAYSFNVTVVPFPAGQPLNYLTVWPSDQNQPVVSTLNNPTATVVANGAIVPAATQTGKVGDIDVFAYNSTDLIIDINGYFATPGQSGYSLYPAAPCRVYDSRNNGGQPFQGQRTVNVVNSPCAPPADATGYVLNATVVPTHSLGYLTLWPDGEDQPVVSTLNAYDGRITSNLAIVPNLNGSIDAYVSDLTHLILDISGYFGPESPGSVRYNGSARIGAPSTVRRPTTAPRSMNHHPAK